jgi:hypothetical protein
MDVGRMFAFQVEESISEQASSGSRADAIAVADVHTKVTPLLRRHQNMHSAEDLHGLCPAEGHADSQGGH